MGKVPKGCFFMEKAHVSLFSKYPRARGFWMQLCI